MGASNFSNHGESSPDPSFSLFHRCLYQVVQCVAQAVSEGKSELREEEALAREEQLRLERQLEQTLADANNKGKEGGEVVLGRRLCFSHVSYLAHSTPKASFAPPDPLFACLVVVFSRTLWGATPQRFSTSSRRPRGARWWDGPWSSSSAGAARSGGRA